MLTEFIFFPQGNEASQLTDMVTNCKFRFRFQQMLYLNIPAHLCVWMYFCIQQIELVFLSFQSTQMRSEDSGSAFVSWIWIIRDRCRSRSSCRYLSCNKTHLFRELQKSSMRMVMERSISKVRPRCNDQYTESSNIKQPNLCTVDLFQISHKVIKRIPRTFVTGNRFLT